MMQISHAATGAAVGKFIPNPFLAFVAGILIHFVIDKIPHYWPATNKRLKTILLIFDYAFAIMFIASLFLFDVNNLNVLMGVAGSLVLDIVLIGVPAVFKSSLGRWHENRQVHLASPVTFATDLIIIAIVSLLVFVI